jgi:hypothetical protein
MSWRERIRQLALAGGAWSLASCGGGNLPGQPGQPGQQSTGCGNGNPDPCLCGPTAECDAKHACEQSGGSWFPYYSTDATGTVPPHCTFDGGAGPDAAPTADAGPDEG